MSSNRSRRRRSEDLVARARAEMTDRHVRDDAGPASGTQPRDPVPGRGGKAPNGRPARQGAQMLLLLGGIVALMVLRFVLGDEMRARVDETACALTGCAGTGMATVGWLVVVLPVLWLAAVIGLWARLSGPARVAAGLVGLTLGLVGWTHVPGKRTSLATMLDGPGAGAMATGIRWGGVGVALTVLGGLFLAGRLDSRQAGGERRARHRTGPALVAVAAVLGTLVVAMVRADSVPVTVATAMPETSFTVAGDTLRRTSATDLRGCAGVLADDDPLAGCVRTVRVSYTTDDSDAVVHLAAVLFAGEGTARDRRDGLRAGTGQAGVSGDVITVAATTGSWLLLTSVGHADGRSIAEPDRGHLLWAAKQVSYRFIGRQVGLLVAPSPRDGIGPRTP